MQQEDFSLLSKVICIGKMPLEFSDDFCTPCEPNARIWHKGNDSIGRPPIVVVNVADVELPEVLAISLLSSRYLTIPLTVSAA